MMAHICNTVLALPNLSAASTMPSSMAMARRPVTISSRHTMTMTTQAGAQFRWTNMMSTEQMSTLSASGSRNFPMLVTMFRRRAM